MGSVTSPTKNTGILNWGYAYLSESWQMLFLSDRYYNTVLYFNIIYNILYNAMCKIFSHSIFFLFLLTFPLIGHAVIISPKLSPGCPGCTRGSLIFSLSFWGSVRQKCTKRSSTLSVASWKEAILLLNGLIDPSRKTKKWSPKLEIDSCRVRF